VATGGKCLVSSRAICSPTKFSGLGISALQAQGIALRTRRLWMEWTDPSKSWPGLHLPIDAKVRELFTCSAVALFPENPLLHLHVFQQSSRTS
jgi:hypothetical protein